MRKIAAIALLIAAWAAPSVVNADGMEVKHWRHIGRGCGFDGRIYHEGQFCTLACRFASCITQTCHHGHWVIPPATCPAGFGCSEFC
jgi:hypothetical protein